MKILFEAIGQSHQSLTLYQKSASIRVCLRPKEAFDCWPSVLYRSVVHLDAKR